MTNEAKSTEEGKGEGAETKEAEGLSLRDALEVAVAAQKDATETEKTEKVEAAPKEEPAKVEPQAKVFEPPSEWDAEDKELFRKASTEQQEATLKLHRKRHSTLESIKAEKAELQWVKDLAKEVEPYLKTMGEKRPAHEALTLALRMRNEFENGDPKKAAAAYLKAKGFEPPKELLEQQEVDGKLDEKLTPLQKEIDALKQKQAQADQERLGHVLGVTWQEFEQEKNAAGGPKHPDISNGEAGLRLASNIGSLVTGKHPESAAFFGRLKSRIPNASMKQVLQEGYKWFDGRVDEQTPGTRTQDTQSSKAHILKSNRASASRPGGGRPTVSGPVKKYKSTREAAAAALAEIREREGA